ncbi:hypothetical protein [Chryseobacterium nematophagum]|nr:hypothetical protein [Chryseobacterium nematophagum]
MITMEKSYEYLSGKTKVQVVDELGKKSEFSSSVWVYVLKIDIFNKKTILYIYFDGEVVTHTKLIKVSEI